MTYKYLFIFVSLNPLNKTLFFQLKFWLYSAPVSILVFKKAYPIMFHIQMDIWISYAAFDISTFEVVTYWLRNYVIISFMWIFELTNDIYNTCYDIFLPRSCLFSLFGHLIWLWISELPKKKKKTFDSLVWTFELENL